MPANKRPSRERKMPKRLASPSVQIETLTHSQSGISVENDFDTPTPTTPTISTASSPSSRDSTPCPAVRAAGSEWRKTIRATLPTSSEIGSAPRPSTQASARPSIPPVRMPSPTPEDEYDENPPYFGLNHTPEWDDMGIDIDDDEQPRWFPSGLMAPPSYESLSSAAKLMLMHELTKKMEFKNVVAFLKLTDKQLVNFTEVYEEETQRDFIERELTMVAMKRLDTIRRFENRAVTVEDWDMVMQEELDSKLPATVLESPIPLVEIGEAIVYLQSHHVQEKVSEFQASITGDAEFVMPPLFVIEAVIEEMKKYTQLGTTFDWDFTHELGLKEWIENETYAAGGVEGIELSDDERGEEVEEPARRPIGRPKKRGRQFANKPVRNKSDLLKLKLPSKLQQMESVDDEDEDEVEVLSKAGDKGKGRKF
ncbi:hypothetical protein OCU04_002153 [Sclerotinia nivalis]|uniref:Uncharacterized protein n=1 Tax=Sclerotinia nivalis TaxID=352851 RepID=A0A9X0AZJ2_9HELO|nr:hypothetical protein OCU04_002153 [Sclerotinia nivalis]